jgi:hypothetical protein
MMATTGGWLRNVNAAVGNPMKMLLWCLWAKWQAEGMT